MGDDIETVGMKDTRHWWRKKRWWVGAIAVWYGWSILTWNALVPPVFSPQIEAGDIRTYKQILGDGKSWREEDFHRRFGGMVLARREYDDGGNLKSDRRDRALIHAIRRFPDVTSCLQRGAVAKSGEVDLDAIHWSRFRNDGDAKICLFMIFEKLGGPEEVKEWFSHQGYKTTGVRVTPEYIHVSGGWLLNRPTGEFHRAKPMNLFPKFPTSGLMKYVLKFLASHQDVVVTLFPNGKIKNISIHTPSSIFN